MFQFIFSKNQIRRILSAMVVDDFIGFWNGGSNLNKQTLGIFGMITNNKDIMVEVESPLGDQRDLFTLTDVVYNAWKTICINGQLNRQELIQALCDDSLPQWYEAQIRNNGYPLSYYSKALIDNDLFEKINWDSVMCNKSETNTKSQDTLKLKSKVALVNKRSKCGRCWDITVGIVKSITERLLN